VEYKEIHLIIQDECMHTLNLFEPKNPKRLKYPESIYPDEEIQKNVALYDKEIDRTTYNQE
jgi:hypothetical protein